MRLSPSYVLAGVAALLRSRWLRRRVTEAVEAAGRCQPGAVRGYIVGGDPAGHRQHARHVHEQEAGDRLREFNCAGAAPQARRVNVGVYEVRFPGTPPRWPPRLAGGGDHRWLPRRRRRLPHQPLGSGAPGRGRHVLHGARRIASAHGKEVRLTPGDVELRNVTYRYSPSAGMRRPSTRWVWRSASTATMCVTDGNASTRRTRSSSTQTAAPSAWRTRSRRSRPQPSPRGRSSVACELRLGRVRDLRGAQVDGRVERLPGLRRADHRRDAWRSAGRRQPALPLPRARRAVVGRHRLHLKRDEPLPVGRAHRPLARRPSAGGNDHRLEAVRAGSRVVARPPRDGLATPRPEPGDPRRHRPHQGLLAASVAARPGYDSSDLRDAFRARIAETARSRNASGLSSGEPGVSTDVPPR